jgi:hypothetical protein
MKRALGCLLLLAIVGCNGFQQGRLADWEVEQYIRALEANPREYEDTQALRDEWVWVGEGEEEPWR